MTFPIGSVTFPIGVLTFPIDPKKALWERLSKLSLCINTGSCAYVYTHSAKNTLYPKRIRFLISRSHLAKKGIGVFSAESTFARSLPLKSLQKVKNSRLMGKVKVLMGKVIILMGKVAGLMGKVAGLMGKVFEPMGKVA